MSTGPGADSAPAPNEHHHHHTTATGATNATTGHTPRSGPTGAAGPTREVPVPAETGRTATGARTGAAPRSGADAEPDTEPAAKPSMFSSLRVRNYRLFASGQLVSNTGTWMQRIAQDWLVHSLTGSATAVGLTVALQFLPMLLFGLYGGVIADRCAKRRLLLLTQSTMSLTGLALAALTLSGSVQVWHVYALAFALGLVTVVDNPARQTFVAEMVGPGQLRNAVSLNSANFQSARLVGPAVAGVMITAVGSGWAFLINGLSFLAPIAALLLMRQAELSPVEPVPRARGQLREGLRYVRGRPELLWPIILVGSIGTFGLNFPIWLTAFTEHVFDQGAGVYGLLNVLLAAGSLAGALLAARRTTSRMRLLVGSAAAFGALLGVAALTPWFWVFAGLMVAVGIMGLTFNVTANSSIQLATDSAMRGRVMSLFMMVFVGGTPIGGPVMGWITDTYGPRVGLLAGGLVSVLAAGLVALALARTAGLRLSMNLRRGSRLVAFVPRAPESAARSGPDGRGSAGHGSAGEPVASTPAAAPAKASATATAGAAS
ncbi:MULTISPECIES: MFS transporter [unclassified Streptomyces]|uniref:MFS transporter n=1 Tax=unclassified Streptomyces TaxID=2593676 RepID=UPI0022B70318|nr:MULTISPECIES: MFS transporter [unclassified Streptomyces]MCZ7414877.1 MFS transporter [Streptomyces sp. WMMC897]MCZ7431820.1 MFS transporter [Streptomyces sp. WMMC1477]